MCMYKALGFFFFGPRIIVKAQIWTKTLHAAHSKAILVLKRPALPSWGVSGGPTLRLPYLHLPLSGEGNRKAEKSWLSEQ